MRLARPLVRRTSRPPPPSTRSLRSTGHCVPARVRDRRLRAAIRHATRRLNGGRSARSAAERGDEKGGAASSAAAATVSCSCSLPAAAGASSERALSEPSCGPRIGEETAPRRAHPTGRRNQPQPAPTAAQPDPIQNRVGLRSADIGTPRGARGGFLKYGSDIQR